MKFLHYDLKTLGSDEVVEVKLDKQANVRLLDHANFNQYRSGKKYKFYGGLAKKSPVRLAVPNRNHWHLVIDLQGYTGRVNASVNVLKPETA